jgi:hypothetical protein
MVPAKIREIHILCFSSVFTNSRPVFHTTYYQKEGLSQLQVVAELGGLCYHLHMYISTITPYPITYYVCTLATLNTTYRAYHNTTIMVVEATNVVV